METLASSPDPSVGTTVGGSIPTVALPTVALPTVGGSLPTVGCSFIPMRHGQAPCKEVADVVYGDKGFCKKHSRTVQGATARDKWRDAQPKPVIETPPVVVETPPVAVAEQPPVVVEAPVVEAPTPVVEAPVVEQPAVVVKETPKKTVKQSSTPTVKQPSTGKKDVEIKLASDPEPIKRKETRVIKINSWGRYEDKETGIIFDPTTKTACGVQDHKTGRINPLSSKHIEICEKYKWKYKQIVPVAKQTPVKKTISKKKKEESSSEESSSEQEEEEESEEEDSSSEEEEESEEDSSSESSSSEDATPPKKIPYSIGGGVKRKPLKRNYR